MSTALRSVGLLGVVHDYACAALGRAPCIHARLRLLVTKPYEKCGLASTGDHSTAHPHRQLDLATASELLCFSCTIEIRVSTEFKYCSVSC